MKLTGRCLCGNCTWETTGKPNWAGNCHCESCRRHCAAPFTSFFGINNGHWQWTGATPAELNTSVGVTRYFCSECGTPMAYHNVKWAHEVHFYLAAMDDVGALSPQFHVHWAERVPWLYVNDDLPKFEGSADDG